jgi:hypothetical protein
VAALGVLLRAAGEAARQKMTHIGSRAALSFAILSNGRSGYWPVSESSGRFLKIAVAGFQICAHFTRLLTRLPAPEAALYGRS